MRPLFLLPLLALLPLQFLSAQTVIDAGAAVGQQAYESSIDDPRVLTGIEVLARRGASGLYIAVEYADLSEESALIVIHPDFVYRWTLPAHSAVSIGGGPTLANLGGSGGGLTWNAELELERRWSRAALFARVRQFGLARFREREAGPKGPAAYVGFPVNVRS
ncbi:MAG: hypothetical protein AABO58_06595 [Acidobacteriota bacterium]